MKTRFRDAFELLNGLTMPDGTSWGSFATPIQRRDARALLSPQGPRRHWIGRARGYSKTEDLAALTLVAMLVLLRPGDEAYCVARDRDQARILVDRIRGFVRRSGLEGAFESIGSYVLVTKVGVRLEALSCDVGSAWGLTPAWVVVDELCQHPETSAARELFEAIVSSLPKKRGSRLAIITTSGSPGHWSHDVYERAEREASWRVSMTYGPCPWMDRAEVDEARRSLPASTFARLFENRWTQGEDRLFDPADVGACVCLPGPLEFQAGRRYAIGVDLALRNDRAALCVGHVEGDVLRLDRLDVFTPAKDRDVDLQAVEDLIAVRAREYGGAPATFDPAQAWQMMQRLRRRGVTCREHSFTAGSNSRRTLLLLQLVRERRLHLPEDRELVDELVNLRVREVSPGVYRYDHDPTKHDDRVTALSLVALICERVSGSAKARASRGSVSSPTTTRGLDPARQLLFADGRRARISRGSVQDRIGGLRYRNSGYLPLE